MKNDLDSKLARLESLLADLGKDVENRLMVIDRLLRDVTVKVDVLERRADVQRRLDAVRLRERAHAINETILKLLDGENPDAVSAAKLFIIKNILEAPVNLEDPQSLKALATAARALGGDAPVSMGPVENFQV